MSRKRPLTRNQLAEFLPNHEAIKAFERIMDEVYDLLPTDVIAINQAINDLALSLGYADAKAEIESGNSRQFDYIDFPQIAPVAPAARRLYYDDGDGTLMLTLKGGNSTLPIGQSEFELCFNGAATAMARGTVVQITGAQGNRIKIDRARADAEATSNHTFGFVDESIASGSEGFVLNSGLIRKLNTITDSEGNALTQGDTLYLSTSVSGGYTRVKPVAPNHLVIVGFVVRVHASVGEIFVKVDNGYEIDELHNVYAPSPANGNTLIYNSTTSRWEASSSFDAVNIATINSATTLRLQTSGVDRVTVDAAGNAGLGVVPSAWDNTAKVLEFSLGSVSSSNGLGTVLNLNSYYSTNWKYKSSGVGAMLYSQASSGHLWSVAPSGTAGAPITFSQAMTLTQGGNLLVGTNLDAGNRISAQVTSSGVFQGAYTASNGADSDFTVRIRTNETQIANSTGGGVLSFATVNTERARITSGGNFRPGADNAYSLGEPSFRWSVVYAATGTINTSDERAKLDFAPTLGLDFIAALEPVSYRYKNGKTVIDQVEDGTEEVPAVLDEDGNEVTPATTRPKYKSVERVVEGTRRHHGLKAQQVKSVLDTFGTDFAGWVLENLDDPNSGQGLRYDQFIAPLIKAVQELSAQNAALTDRIAALEAKSS
ncbi:MAG TPA: tail fiber domain-containing protein [Pseudomonadales bacterium]|nr:tail fiber domain-containing protein [Pseudomonadales bacterium]